MAKRVARIFMSTQHMSSSNISMREHLEEGKSGESSYHAVVGIVSEQDASSATGFRFDLNSLTLSSVAILN